MAKKGSSIKPIAPYVIGDPEQKTPWGGINTAIKDNRSLDRGQTYDELNWICGRDRDYVELRRGQALLGTTRRNIPGHVSGLGVGVDPQGAEVTFYSFNRSLMFFNNATQDTQEINTTNILPDAANDEDVSFTSYEGISWANMFATSKNSSVYKIPIANPDSAVDLQAQHRFNFMKINRGMAFAVDEKGNPDRGNTSLDGTSLWLSDQQSNDLADYPSHMSLPPAPTLVQGTGGSLADGTYYFVVTVFGLDGTETTPGAESSIVISGGGGSASVTISFPNVAGAVSYNIYGSTTPGTYVTPSKTNPIPILVNLGSQNSYNFIGPFLTGQPPSSSTQPLIPVIATGDGTTRTFSGILPSFSPTVFLVVITDGTEFFLDNGDGSFTGSLGGTGTINYATGAYSVTFNTAPTASTPITASFYTDDSHALTNFTVANQFPEADGAGKARAVLSYQGVEYSLHALRSWVFTVTQGATGNSYTNDPYYEQIGIPSSRSAFPTGDGILFYNNANPAQPTLSILQIPPGSTNLTVVPIVLSKDIDLSGFGSGQCVVYRWNEYDIIELQTVNDSGAANTYNSITFIRNWQSENPVWDILDYEFGCLGTFNGTLISGDSLSPNLFTLFSGFDDDEQIINNYRKSSYVDLDLPGEKKVRYVKVQGLIQPNQKLQFSLSLDEGAYVPYYTILGNGPYVGTTPVGIGTYTIGSNPDIIGGGGSGNPGSIGQIAYPYEVVIPVMTDKFEYISHQVKALDVGYVRVSRVEYMDIRWKRKRLSSVVDLQIDN